jgi:diguanylate cyclase
MFARTLQSRIVLFFVALLGLVQGTALLLIDTFNERNARESIRQELATGERIFKRLLDQNNARLAQAAQILAADFAFREAVASRDIPTIRSALVNHGSRIEADMMSLVSLDRRIIADSREPLASGQPPAFASLLEDAERGGRATGLVTAGGRAYQVAVVPVMAPTPIAWAAIGYLVDDRMARDLRNLSSLDVSFLARGANGWTLLASTVPPEAQALALQAAAAPAGTVVLQRREFVTLVLPLDSLQPPGIVAVLDRPLDEAMAPFARLGTLLAVLLAGSIAVSVAGSILIARGVTRRLSVLAQMTRSIVDGSYAEPVDERGPDEVSELARSFNHMREAIAAREKEVLRLAYRDPLSDLPNRALFNDRLRTAVESARRSRSELTVLLLDLDRFKYINDTLGHHVGDQVLQQVAQRVSALVRRSDTTARLGGDEFAVLLVHSGANEGLGVAQKIVATLEQPISIGQHSLDVRASVGAATFPAHGGDADTLVRHADAAMYAAKRAKSGVASYDPRMHEQREEQLSLLSELQSAIDHGELRLVYQPKVELLGARVSGIEALIRWQHPRKGMIMPDAFVPFAEQTGFVKALSAWVIDAAARQAAAWRAAGRPIKVSINLAAQDLLNPGLDGLLVAALGRNRLPPHLLCIEITESGVMQDAARAIAALERIHDLGIGRAIDDFGTGYSSLAYVKQLKVDELKIDRSFVCNLVADTKDRAIVLSTIELAHNLGLTVVAEGVEDETSAQLLRELGCDEMQGYLVSRPLEAPALEAWLVKRGALVT